MRRSRIRNGKSKHMFRQGSANVHSLNSSGSRHVMRGGIRL